MVRGYTVTQLKNVYPRLDKIILLTKINVCWGRGGSRAFAYVILSWTIVQAGLNFALLGVSTTNADNNMYSRVTHLGIIIVMKSKADHT